MRPWRLWCGPASPSRTIYAYLARDAPPASVVIATHNCPCCPPSRCSACPPPAQPGNVSLVDHDPEMADIIEKEKNRQWKSLELIASEVRGR